MADLASLRSLTYGRSCLPNELIIVTVFSALLSRTEVEKTQGEEAQKSVAPPPTAQTVWTSGALDGAICTLWQYN